MSHTPGPWVVVRIHSYYGTFRILAAAKRDRKRMCGKGCCDPAQPGEMEADARLIAAAPELLEACKMALAEDHCTPDVDKVLQAAIAKAEGEVQG